MITTLPEFEGLPLLHNHDPEKSIGTTDDFKFGGKRLCIAPGYIQKEDGTIDILEFTIYERDLKTGKFLHHKK